MVLQRSDSWLVQARHYDTTLTIPEYMDKSFYKTATLIAASCKSAAVFSGLPQGQKDACFEYGRHLGLAFQVVDDILDFTQTSEQLGKPQVHHASFCLGSARLQPQDKMDWHSCVATSCLLPCL